MFTVHDLDGNICSGTVWFGCFGAAEAGGSFPLCSDCLITLIPSRIGLGSQAKLLPSSNLLGDLTNQVRNGSLTNVGGWMQDGSCPLEETQGPHDWGQLQSQMARAAQCDGGRTERQEATAEDAGRSWGPGNIHQPLFSSCLKGHFSGPFREERAKRNQGVGSPGPLRRAVAPGQDSPFGLWLLSYQLLEGQFDAPTVTDEAGTRQSTPPAASSLMGEEKLGRCSGTPPRCLHAAPARPGRSPSDTRGRCGSSSFPEGSFHPGFWSPCFCSPQVDTDGSTAFLEERKKRLLEC